MNDFLIEVFKDTKKLYTTDESLKEKKKKEIILILIFLI